MKKVLKVKSNQTVTTKIRGNKSSIMSRDASDYTMSIKVRADITKQNLKHGYIKKYLCQRPKYRNVSQI